MHHWTEDQYEANNAEVIDQLQRTGIPFILFDRFIRTRKTSGVAVQNYEFSRILVETLLRSGVRHPLCLSSAYSLTSLEREKGFIDACRDAGIENPEHRVHRFEVERITFANYDLVESLVNVISFDGFFTINSSLGNGLVDVIARHPEHHSTPGVGFEDYDMRNRHRFTQVAKSSVYDTSYAAGELIVFKIREKNSTLFHEPAMEVRFPCNLEFIHREKHHQP